MALRGLKPRPLYEVRVPAPARHWAWLAGGVGLAEGLRALDVADAKGASKKDVALSAVGLAWGLLVLSVRDRGLVLGGPYRTAGEMVTVRWESVIMLRVAPACFPAGWKPAWSVPSLEVAVVLSPWAPLPDGVDTVVFDQNDPTWVDDSLRQAVPDGRFDPQAFRAAVATVAPHVPVRVVAVAQHAPHERTLAALEDGVLIRRRLAHELPARHLESLALTLDKLSLECGGLGRVNNALSTQQQATAVYRTLSTADPRRYAPQLATSLTNLSARLSAVGDDREALAAIEEAVAISRWLVAAHRDHYQGLLASTLQHLATRLSNLDRHQDAITALEESITFRYRLAESSPDAYLSALASSLHTLSTGLQTLGREDNARAVSEEAVALQERAETASKLGSVRSPARPSEPG